MDTMKEQNIGKDYAIYDSEGTHPGFLIKTFIVFSVISAIVIFSLINYGMYKIFQKHSIHQAENSAVSVSKTLFELERQSLLTTGDGGEQILAIQKEHFPLLDERMKKYLHTFDIVKIKVFSIAGKVIYSTDHAIIGEMNRDNENLQKALKGEIISKLERKDRVMDIAGEQRFDVDVVETYVPVSTEDGSIIGSFEVYLDITKYRESVKRFVTSSLIVTVIIMTAVLGFLFVLMLHGAKQLRRAHEHMQELASTDGLTNLLNRRFLVTRAEEEFARIRRIRTGDYSAPSFGVIMLDIDHFKKVNDVHGHLVGDEILRQLARRIRDCIRKYEIAGRYGGEEFIIIAPNANLKEAQAIAERIWKAVREDPFETNGQKLHVTVSIGVSCLTLDDTSVENVIKRADEALYIAKADGRDRVSAI